MPTDWYPRSISFSSGGVRTIGHLGVLARLLETGLAAHVTDWYGCSGGSITAIFGAIGVSAAWIRDCVRQFDTRHMFTIQEEFIMDYMVHWGMDSGEHMITYLGKILDTWEPGVSMWTFADFARERPGVFLGITAVNLETRTLDLFSVKQTPNIRLLDAIRASSAIPFIYTPWRSPQGDLYCDGAILERCPWFHVRQKKETLVVACERSQITGVGITGRAIHTFADYCMRILFLHLIEPTDESPRYWIAVNNTTVTSIDFKMSSEERFALFKEGEVAADSWIAFRQARCAKMLQTPPDSVHPHTSSESRPSAGDKTSDIRRLRIPSPRQAAARDSQGGTPRSCRRWSL